jgi:glycosyltransferase involved in cell wall biosynthesis
MSTEHEKKLETLQREVKRLRAENERLRSSVAFRHLLPVIWKVRRTVFPAPSRRYRGYLRVRSAVAARVRRTAPVDRAEMAKAVPKDKGLSCVVLSLGAPPELVDAVRSLMDQDPAPEVVVVNSGGGQADELLRAAGLNPTVVLCSRRLLPGAARNVGIAATHEPWVAFMASDCTAEPGWVRGRLAAHHAGAAVVSSAVTNPYPWNPFATASHLLRFSRRLPGSPPSDRLHYGSSYLRSLFTRLGRFKPDLYWAEDTELNRRYRRARRIRFAYRGDVRSAHKNPTSAGSLIRDQFKRGRRMMLARKQLYGGRDRGVVLRRAPRGVWRSIIWSFRAYRIRDWGQIIWSLPWLLVGQAAFAIGVATAPDDDPMALTAPRSPAPTSEPRLLCVIQFRNERTFLPGFLENVAPHVDGILALDDGSTDGSTEIVESHPAVLEMLRIAPNEPHEWDELRSKRLLIDAASRHGGDWVIALDADERLESGFRDRVDREIERADRENHLAYRLTLRELWDSPDRYRVDGVWGKKVVARLFRLRDDHEFSSMALHGPWAPQNSRSSRGTFPRADLIIYHLRMINPDHRERRQLRYMELDPDRRWQSIGYEYMTDLEGLELAAVPSDRGYSPIPDRVPPVDNG